MSKYIKLEGALKAVRDNTMPLDCWHIDRMRAIVDLPTIEVSEDCISREYLLSKVYDMDNDNLVVDLKDIEDAPSVTAEVGGWKWEAQDICDNCGYEIPHLERVIGETVLMDSRDWGFCPNCGSRRKGN